MEPNEKIIESQEEEITVEEILGPPKVDISYVGLVAIGSIIAGFVGGIIVLVSIYFFLGKMKGFEGAYPVIFSLTGFFALGLTSYLTLLMHQIIAPDKYRKGVTTFGQVSIFLIFLYIFIAPAYLYAANIRIELLTYIFTIHIIIGILGVALISEIISSYRYVLLGVYGSFIGFFVSVFICIVIFLTFPSGQINLFALIGIIMVMNLFVNSFRAIFEYGYYMIYKLTGYDQLGDIFSKGELEEKELEKKAKEQLEKF